MAETLDELADFGNELECIPTLQGDEILEKLSRLRGDVLEEVQGVLTLTIEIQEFYETLVEQIDEKILQDPAIIDKLLASGKHIKELVHQNINLGHLSQAINRLTTTHDQLEQFIEPLRDVSQTLGEPASKHLTIGESGFIEFKTIIELVSMLNPSHWKYRNPLFDNEELDELLPQLHSEINNLRRLRDVVNGVFTLERLPAEEEVRQLQKSLAAGGPFKWFKRDLSLIHISEPTRPY